MMPFISRLELISYVKQINLKNTNNSFSSAGQEDIVLKAFNLGATDFMSKPISLMN
jgi:CheY-like chemotaxis protein